jgi:hypothetical protein
MDINLFALLAAEGFSLQKKNLESCDSDF